MLLPVGLPVGRVRGIREPNLHLAVDELGEDRGVEVGCAVRDACDVVQYKERVLDVGESNDLKDLAIRIREDR